MMRGPRLAGLVLALAPLCLVARPAGAGEIDAAVPPLGACGPVAGVYRLPGTDGCLRLSGFVAAEAGGSLAAAKVPGFAATMGTPMATPPAAWELGRSAIGADARLSVDASLPTDYGPARVFVSLRARHGVLAPR